MHPRSLFRLPHVAPDRCSFFFYCYGDRRDLHSFPTRRSSDLPAPGQVCAFAHRTSSPRLAAGRGEEVRWRSEEHTSELQSQSNLVCRLLLEKKKPTTFFPILALIRPMPQRAPTHDRHGSFARL